MTAVPLLRVESPGLLTTVQDLGRWGHQRDGMVVAGAMDPFAAVRREPAGRQPARGGRAGDHAAGADPARPGRCAPGPVRRRPVAVRGRPARAPVEDDDICAKARRSPLAAAGRARGPIWPSRAASPSLPSSAAARRFCADASAASQGRRLEAGDVLEGSPPIACLLPSAACGRADIPAYALPAVLRVLPGPHPSAFTDAGRDTFFSATYTVSPQSDRQGYRLTAPPSPAQMRPTSFRKPCPGAASRSRRTGSRSC